MLRQRSSYMHTKKIYHRSHITTLQQKKSNNRELFLLIEYKPSNKRKTNVFKDTSFFYSRKYIICNSKDISILIFTVM